MRKGEYKTALPGERFGRLVVIEANGKSRKCKCDCGSIITVCRTSALTSGNTQSCGCLRKEITGNNRRKHGMCKTKVYAIWTSMIQRCTNPNNHKFKRYGGRGITVCQRWQESFEAFFQDMGNPPFGYTLDRINNDGPYSPENCRWADDKTQARNRSNNHILTHQGQSHTIAEWAEELNIPRTTISTRLRLGWDDDKVLSEEANHVM